MTTHTGQRGKREGTKMLGQDRTARTRQLENVEMIKQDKKERT
jgi:hypothetical protein